MADSSDSNHEFSDDESSQPQFKYLPVNMVGLRNRFLELVEGRKNAEAGLSKAKKSLKLRNELVTKIRQSLESAKSLDKAKIDISNAEREFRKIEAGEA